MQNLPANRGGFDGIRLDKYFESGIIKIDGEKTRSNGEGGEI